MLFPPPLETPPAGDSVDPRPIVLLVDDDLPSAEGYLNAIGADGMADVIHVRSGKDAIEQLNRHGGIDCVVAAIELPEMDGFEVLRATRILRPLTPVLLISGLSDPSHPSLAIREGADDLLIAPVTADALREHCAALVAKGRAAKAAGARTVLAIGAHPDDVEIGVAGTLLRHVAAGDRVIHLMMTDGEVGGHQNVRIEEAERAAESIGMTLVRAHLPDAFVSDARETLKIVERAVSEYSPSVVYVHSPRDGHQDHRASFHAAASASRGVPTLCGYQSPSSTADFRPNRFIDIGDYLDAKIAVINIYRSQTATRLYLAEDMIRATARYWGRHAAHRLVEPLEVMWQLSA
jgi:LmbE family N-acetylglucosaminyl deacetylase